MQVNNLETANATQEQAIAHEFGTKRKENYLKITKKLKSIRMVLYRHISLDKISRESLLYQSYVSNTLTEKQLLSSDEDPFIIAFFFKNFNIINYLKYLSTQEISNVTYNVLKMYLEETPHLVEDLIACVPSYVKENKAFLRTLEGELYRNYSLEKIRESKPINSDANKLSQENILQSLDEFFILGYTTIGEQPYKNFKEIFAAYVKINPGFLYVVDLSADYVLDAISTNLRNTFNFVLEENIDVFERINYNEGEIDTIKALFIEKYKRIRNYKDKDAFLEKLHNFADVEDLERRINFYCELSENYSFYEKIKEDAIEIISKIKESPYCSIFNAIHFYYEKSYIFEEKYNTLDENEMKELSSPCSFYKTVMLYSKYNAHCAEIILNISDLIALPDKFFLLGLERLNTPLSNMMREFHLSLSNERKKEQIYQKILKLDSERIEISGTSMPENQYVFLKYLVSRNIWFNINWAEHEMLLDDQYKMLYAEYNIDWAVKNIGELRKIGLSRFLYSKIKKSQYKDILTVEDLKAAQKQLECEAETGDFISKRNIMDESSFDDRKDIKRIYFDSPFSEAGKKNTETFESSVPVEETDNAADVNENSYNILASKIFDNIKAKTLEAMYLEPNQLKYVMLLVFDWVKNTNYLADFMNFIVLEMEHLSNSNTAFELSYAEFSSLIHTLFTEFSNQRFIMIICRYISFIDLVDLIRDNEQNSTDISMGIAKRIESDCKSGEVNCLSLVNRLVFSEEKHLVYVGSLIYRELHQKFDLSFTLNHLLVVNNDRVLEVVSEVIKNEDIACNEKILSVILKRATLDCINVNLIKKLRIEDMSTGNIKRIYSMFYLDPVKYLECNVDSTAFAINSTMINEIVSAMGGIYSKALINKIGQRLSKCEFSDENYEAMADIIDCKNEVLAEWIVSSISTAEITAQGFVKLCLYIANSSCLENVEKLLKTMQQGKTYSIVNKWMQNKKLACLSRRVYLLKNKPDQEYLETLDVCDEEERMMLKRVFAV
ncbi:hypothetical protein ENBRE01_0978 [Enteropsectra breve]|nr:hypothetical protein ENBRE01_0978 [Enteropsectra breve]